LSETPTLLPVISGGNKEKRVSAKTAKAVFYCNISLLQFRETPTKRGVSLFAYLNTPAIASNRNTKQKCTVYA
jgi:hypothetical protein